MDDRPTLILLHGAGWAGRMWRRPAELLADEYEVVTPDLPGFSREPTPVRFTMDGAVTAVADLARAHRPPVHIVGFSLGANVAAEVAAAHPDLVDRLMLLAPTLRPAADSPKTLRRYRRLPNFVVRRFADVPDRAGWLAFLDAIEKVNLAPKLPAILAPTLVVCGERDRLNLPDAKAAADAIPGGRFLALPHLGHAWPPSQPKLFTTIVKGFLAVESPSAD